MITSIICLCTSLCIVKVNAEIKSVYSTQNGEREFSHSFKKDVHDHYLNTPLLTPGTSYQFNVTAYTSEGSGPTASVNATLDKGRIGKAIYVHTMYGFYLVI